VVSGGVPVEVHNDAEDCSFLNLFPLEMHENEEELREMLALQIVPRQPQIHLRQLSVELRELPPLQ